MNRPIQRGDLYWVVVPRQVPGGEWEARGDERRAPAELAHPHVVLQDDLFNHSRIETVVVCALTSNPHRGSEPGNVLLELGEGGLVRQSVVVVSQISSIGKSQLGEYIGALSEARVEQILNGLRFLQRSYLSR